MAAQPVFDSDMASIFANQLSAVGRVTDAIVLMEDARKADPLAGSLSFFLQMAYMFAGRYDDSHAEYLRIKGVSGTREDFEHNELFRVWLTGDMEATRLQYRRFLDAQAISLPALRECYDVLDQPQAALSILRKAYEDRANYDGTRMTLIACHAGLHGDTDLAASALRRALLECGFYASQLCWYPFLKDARRTADFKKLVRELGFYDYWRSSGNWGDFARPVGDDDFEIIR
jgi:hypothetical protein